MQDRRYLPRQRPSNDKAPAAGRPRTVTAAQLFWLSMTVPFTSTAGEQKPASTVVENFPLSVRGAWSNLTGARVRLVGSGSDTPLSSLEVPLRTLAGNTVLAHPMLYWRKPYLLVPQTALRGNFINDGAEASGSVIFACERPDAEKGIPVRESRQYVLLLDLGLTGGATQTGFATTQQLEHGLLIYGALSTSTGMTVRFVDTQANFNWSSQQLPIGAFAGISNGSTNIQPIMYYPKPYYLPPNASIRAEWTNAGAETGKYIAFICERVLL